MTGASMRVQRQAERQFPVRVRIAVPPEGLGRQLDVIHAWLDETCGAEGWTMAPSGLAGVINDALAFYFADAAFADAFVSRFCCGYRIEMIEGAFPIQNDAPLSLRTTLGRKTF